jgi:hypothetical protein
MPFVRCIVAVALLVVLGDACITEQYACPGLEIEDQPAIFQLSCGPTDLTSVSLSGACATADASPTGDAFGSASASVAVTSPNPGQCHVVLTFATGFTYTADVTFTVQTDNGGPGCPSSTYTAPTQQSFTVHNPSTTCVDAGPDAPSEAEAAPPACPSDASQSVPCSAPATCTGCRDDAAFTCTCAETDGGLQWQCSTTGFPCGA